MNVFGRIVYSIATEVVMWTTVRRARRRPKSAAR